jgi:hypothetical protein
MVTNITKITENLGSSLVWGIFFIIFLKSLLYKDSLLKNHGDAPYGSLRNRKNVNSQKTMCTTFYTYIQVGWSGTVDKCALQCRVVLSSNPARVRNKIV